MQTRWRVAFQSVLATLGFLNAVGSGFDATTPDGRTVQIKANHASQTIGIRGEADLLLVVRVEADGSWEELFYGDFQAALSLASWSSRDSKHSISVKALRSLGQRIQEAEGRDP